MTTRGMTGILVLGLGWLPGLAAEMDWEGVRKRATELLSQQKPQEAIRVYISAVQQARNEQEITLGLGRALIELGSLYMNDARLLESEQVLQQAIAIGAGHAKGGVVEASALRCMAELRMVQERRREAEKLLNRAESRLTGQDGDAREELARILTVAATLHWELGRREQARNSIERASKMLEGIDKAQYGVTLFLLARFLWEEGHAEKAETLIREVNGLWLQTDGPHSAAYMAGLVSLAIVVSKRNPAEADECFRRALEGMERSHGPDHMTVGFILLQYAQHLQEHGERKQAKALRKRAEPILARYRQENRLDQTVEFQAFQPRKAK
jgi:tetratricopeptide (TPR) repeat protein